MNLKTGKEGLKVKSGFCRRRSMLTPLRLPQAGHLRLEAPPKTMQAAAAKVGCCGAGRVKGGLLVLQGEAWRAGQGLGR
jgi:hypothetical protein